MNMKNKIYPQWWTNPEPPKRYVMDIEGQSSYMDISTVPNNFYLAHDGYKGPPIEVEINLDSCSKTSKKHRCITDEWEISRLD